MYVITFYSFKGGVGRTMALVNVAAELVRRGRKVLVVDFDLEAPGLETYKHLQPPAEPRQRPGIVEYVTKFRENYEVPDLLEYVYEVKPIGKRGGRLWVMPAGRRDRAYRVALTKLDWQRLYSEEQGFLLFEDTKKGWEVELQPDYVLIDSRTGDTDVLGICTRQLPDSVVLMFTPNEQNLAGLEGVCRDIRREETAGLKKEIRLHFVAANVPDLDDEHRILRRQLQEFRKRLDFEMLSGVIRRYENLNLLDQSIFAIDRPHSRLARAYRRLLRKFLMDNLGDRDGTMFYLQRCRKRVKARLDSYPTEQPERENGQPDEKKGRFRVTVGIADLRDDNRREAFVKTLTSAADTWLEEHEHLLKIAQQYHANVEILANVADCFILKESYQSAIGPLNRMLELKPDVAAYLLKRASCKINLFDVDGAADDLLTCVRTLGLPNEAHRDQPALSPAQRLTLQLTCLERLCAMPPTKLVKLAEMVEAKEIQEIPLESVASCLCRREEGVELAARLLRHHVARLDQQASIDGGILWALLGARCWREVIQLHEARRFDEGGARTALGVGLAHWGEHGAMPELLCRNALEEDDQRLRWWAFEARSWLLWRIGNVADAIEYLDKATKRAREEVDEKPFSLWQLRRVSVQEYLVDCSFVRRMFQGEPLRPAFLGPASS